MVRMARFVCLISILLSIVAAPAAVAQQGGVSFTASVDRAAISTDDQLTLTITLAGSMQNIPEPRLSNMDGFQVYQSGRAQNVSITNGQVSASVSFTYILRPTRSGQLTIGPAEVSIDGQSYTTQPITVEVVQGRLPTPTPATQSSDPVQGDPAQAPAVPESMGNQKLFVMARTDKQEAYQGEQVTLSFCFYQGIDLFGMDLSYTPPETPGFWAEKLAPDQKYYQQVGQRQYLVQELRTALFPTSAGDQTIGQATLVVDDFFNRYPLRTEPLTVKVKPLPEAGKPPEFNGAIGQYEIEATLNVTETTVNEPVTLNVVIRGAGNVSSLPEPHWPEIENARTYNGETKTNVSTTNYVVQGERSFERLIVPKQSGDITIPPIRCAYFDPQAAAYQVIGTSALRMSVKPESPQEETTSILPVDKQNLSIVGQDIRHIKAAPTVLYSQGTSLYQSVPFWATWVLPPLLVAGALFYQRSRRRLTEDIAYARSRRSRKQSAKRLHAARSYLNKGDVDAFYAEVSRALREYLGDRMNVSASGMTIRDIYQALARRGAGESLIERVALCLETGDAGRFAPGAGHEEDMARLLKSTAEVIDELEGFRWNGK